MYERLNKGIEPENRKVARALRALEEFESLNMSENIYHIYETSHITIILKIIEIEK